MGYRHVRVDAVPEVGDVPPAPERVSARSALSGNISAVGTVLFSQFALAFEIVSLVLLAAMVGAIVVARRKTES